MEICNYTNCSGCSLCALVCPHTAIKMEADKEFFLRPVIDENKCISCGVCSAKCPANRQDESSMLSAFAAYNNSPDIRRNSSSGGIFHALATEILEKSGIVFGVGFDIDNTACHMAIESAGELDSIMRSKYMQSSKKDIYKKVKDALKNGRPALFCGTPCECSALSSYLGKSRDGLIMMDFICHGVQTPEIWKRYLNEKVNGNIKSINFRDKSRGWHEFSMKIETDSGSVCESLYTNPALRIFLCNNALRPSCYNCLWKGERSSADITVADFWGINRAFPNMFDDKGTSAVIIRSEAGKEAFEAIKDKLTYRECSPKTVAELNPALYHSATMPKTRDDFFAMLSDGSDYDAIARRFGAPMSAKNIFRERLACFVKKILAIIKKR